jgi:hypothetical protein
LRSGQKRQGKKAGQAEGDSQKDRKLKGSGKMNTSKLNIKSRLLFSTLRRL